MLKLSNEKLGLLQRQSQFYLVKGKNELQIIPNIRT